MPKIIVKVDRKAHTRSKTQEVKKGHPSDGGQGDDYSENKKEATPNKSAQKTEPRSSISRIQRSQVRLVDRKFFNVKEDHVILEYIRQHKDTLTSRSIADNLSKKLKHSSESIRDRVKRFLSKLRPIDELYIAEEAKVNFFSLYIFHANLIYRLTPTIMSTTQRRPTKRREQYPIYLQLCQK